MGKCVVCPSRSDKKSNVTHHRFPKIPNILNKWVEWVRSVKKNDWTPSKTSVLCSAHFEASSFNKSSFRVTLNRNSIPSVLLSDENNPNLPNVDLGRAVHPDQDISCIPDSASISTSVVSSHDDNTTVIIDEVRFPSPTLETTLHDHRYECSPTSLRKRNVQLQDKLRKMQNTYCAQKQQMKRMKAKISSLRQVVSDLRAERRVCETGLHCLESFPDIPLQLCERTLKNCTSKTVSRGMYPAELRSFALTLHFYSPTAYNYVRKTFKSSLPHPSVLRTWYSGINAEPGFVEESFESLRHKVVANHAAGKSVMCSLMLDEMGIKKGIQRDRSGKVWGYVNMGTGFEDGDNVPAAKEALVIMVVAIDSSWKLPIGYFLISSITSETLAYLIKESLIRLHSAGVVVPSLTLDGTPTHISAINRLGCNIKMPTLQPYFTHPSDSSQKVYVLLDTCHMLKLLRNCLAEYKVLLDGNGKKIEWRYIEDLAKIQEHEGLRCGNKLRLSHIAFQKNIMKVRIAAQTLNTSVADSIEFCDKVLNLPQFKDSEGTVRFIRCIDVIFDFFNIRNPLGKGFKSPLRISNESFWRPRIQSEREYLSMFQTSNGQSVLKCKRATGFLGFYTGIQAVFGIFDDHVQRDVSNLKYLLTYKLSQDHLELFFCAIRQRSGWCPNPTSSQFVSVFKRLLVRREIFAANGNAIERDATKILHVSSSTTRKAAKLDPCDITLYSEVENLRTFQKYDLGLQNDTGESGYDLQDFLQFAATLPTNISEFSEHAVGYIAGFVIHKIFKNLKCDQCILACLAELRSHPDEHRLNRTSLVMVKTHGGLITPSSSVVRVCLETEKAFRRAINKNLGKPPVERNFVALIKYGIQSVTCYSKFVPFPGIRRT